MKTLIGIGTFGLTGFTREAVKSLYETVENDFDVCIIVGKPKDEETRVFSESNGYVTITHSINMGFPVAVNDIYEYGWTHGYDAVIIMGNDVIAYPYAVDSLIDTAKEGKYEWIASTQLDVKTLLQKFPELQRNFKSPDYRFDSWGSDPWRYFKGYSSDRQIAEIGLSDVQNLCLYTKGAFDKIGYTDVNFYPAYYIDNDYARRGVNAEVQACTLINSIYFHFWSRTIKQGDGGSTPKQFSRNREFYIKKWGGDFGQEKHRIPFGGNPYRLPNGVILEPTLNIQSRKDEEAIVNYWRSIR
jgi:GT2 family glycosyltransferase